MNVLAMSARRAAAVCAGALLWVLLATATSRAAECADVDCNGLVTATDALAVLRIAVGESLVSPCTASCSGPTTTSTTTPTTTSTTLPMGAGSLVITEIMADPVGVSDSVGEWFEVRNVGTAAVDLRGVTISDDGSDFHRIDAVVPLIVVPGGFFVLARELDPAVNGGVAADYAYDGVTLSNSADELVLSATGGLIDRVAYASGFVVRGRASSLDVGVQDAASNDDPSRWCPAQTDYGSGGQGTPGASNPPCPVP